MKFMVHSSWLRVIIVTLGLFAMVCELTGCEAFVRKFTRKPKKDQEPVEMVLAPEEYKGPEMSKEELYRQYFLYWQSWQDELITALLEGRSHKKQLDCISEAIENLDYLKQLLNAEKQKKLEDYIAQLNDLKEIIEKDIYGNNAPRYRFKAESIRRNILRDFSYQKIKEYLA